MAGDTHEREGVYYFICNCIFPLLCTCVLLDNVSISGLVIVKKSIFVHLATDVNNILL